MFVLVVLWVHKIWETQFWFWFSGIFSTILKSHFARGQHMCKFAQMIKILILCTFHRCQKVILHFWIARCSKSLCSDVDSVSSVHRMISYRISLCAVTPALFLFLECRPMVRWCTRFGAWDAVWIARATVTAGEQIDREKKKLGDR